MDDIKTTSSGLDVLRSPFRLGRIELRNRAVMSPMTRSRSTGSVPGELVTAYYAQRAADPGLIITEGTSPSPNGLGYPRIPGLFDAAQVRGWRSVTDAVHERGGRIFVQLMHTGRIGHEKNLPAGARVVAPSSLVLEDGRAARLGLREGGDSRALRRHDHPRRRL